jgi:hypothetical protein
MRGFKICTFRRIYYDQIKEDGMGRKCITQGEDEKCVLSVPEAKRPLGRPRHRKEDNIKMDLKKRG